MKFRYVAFDPRRHGLRERFKKLLAIFQQLLLATSGDPDEALTWLGRLGDRYGWFDDDYDLGAFTRDLARSGDVKSTPDGAGLVLTGQGEQRLRRDALERIFANVAALGDGDHATRFPGGSGEETEDTRPYAFGDPLEHIAWTPTLRNALIRSASGAAPAPGFPAGLQLIEDDLEVREREQNTSCATVLLVDISHSMILYGEDRMTPAREVALALFELITTRFRKDSLDLVLFGDDAELVPPKRIPYITAGPFHTNTKAGLQLAQEILHARRNVNKQIFMITDGKPSALWRDGRLYKNPFGLDEEIRNRTLDEALRCRKSGISVTTFMVAQDPILVEFVDEFTRLCRGKAYFTGTEGLGTALFVDYMRNRRARV
jgi:uncharacterized protein with von Willebrand factor type A (vWA) domain